MTNFTRIAIAAIVCTTFVGTADAQTPYQGNPYFGNGYAVPVTVRAVPYVPAAAPHTVYVAPRRNVVPVQHLRTNVATNVYRTNTLRIANIAPESNSVRDGRVDSRTSKVRTSPFRGRQAILDSRLTSGTIIR